MKTVKQALKVFEIFNKHFQNEDDTKVLITEIEEIMDDKLTVKISDLATRKDLSDLALQLRAEMSGLATELRADMNQLRLDTQKEITNLANRMELGFKEQLKWTIVLMIGFFSATIAVVKLG